MHSFSYVVSAVRVVVDVLLLVCVPSSVCVCVYVCVCGMCLRFVSLSGLQPCASKLLPWFCSAFISARSIARTRINVVLLNTHAQTYMHARAYMHTSTSKCRP